MPKRLVCRDTIFKHGLRYAIVEQEAFTMEPFESIKASYDFLRNAPYVQVSYAN